MSQDVFTCDDLKTPGFGKLTHGEAVEGIVVSHQRLLDAVS